MKYFFIKSLTFNPCLRRLFSGGDGAAEETEDEDRGESPGSRSPMALAGRTAPQLLLCQAVRGPVALLSLELPASGRSRYFWGSEEEGRAAALPRRSAEWLLQDDVQDIYGFDEAQREGLT